jgi:hypothetical protein
MKLYEKISIEDFETKQKELINLVNGKFPDPNILNYYDPTNSEMSEICPTFYSYILEKTLMPIRFFRIYNSPSGGGLGPHIDGGAFNRSPIGLNIPILNCKNSLMKWWDESNAIMVTGNFGWNGIPATKILNEHELVCIDKVEIDVPTFVRTDFIHSIENYNDVPRIILSIRWNNNSKEGRQFKQVMNYIPYEN